MKEFDVGILPVCDERGLCGVITDRDIVLRVLAAGLDPDAVRIADAMTKNPVYCDEDQNLDEVAKMMQARRIRRIPVMSGQNGLVGMLSITDLARCFEAQRFVGDVVESAGAKH